MKRLKSGLLKFDGQGARTSKALTSAFDLNRRSLQDKYPFIRAFIQTDCEPPLRLDELKQLILAEVDKLPELRTQFDAKWMAIKDEVSGDLLTGPSVSVPARGFRILPGP